MPYFKCNKCHHEWEGAKEDTECDWCGCKKSTILEEKIPLEKMNADKILKQFRKNHIFGGRTLL